MKFEGFTSYLKPFLSKQGFLLQILNLKYS